MILFDDIFRGKKILVTGHTGFKGSWLCLWLQQLGAQVTGTALPPSTNPAHWDLLQLALDSHLTDINHAENIKKVVQQAQPELVIHLAAQPLVRASYNDPLATWQTNVQGTANVLEACRNQSSVKAILVITTDKVYENPEAGEHFSEADPLGGHDPYSASKAACELVVQSYRRSFFAKNNVLVASARAGNVIGGGDWAEDRLVPDIIRAMHSQSPLLIRHPNAIRPWQHVLDSLSGYLCLASALLKGGSDKARAWNFGPSACDNKSVADVLAQMKLHWPELDWKEDAALHPHESGCLTLSSAIAQAQLHWQPVWDFAQTAQFTAEWYQQFYQHKKIISTQQLEFYIHCAQKRGLAWVSF